MTDVVTFFAGMFVMLMLVIFIEELEKSGKIKKEGENNAKKEKS